MGTDEGMERKKLDEIEENEKWKVKSEKWKVKNEKKMQPVVWVYIKSICGLKRVAFQVVDELKGGN